VAVSGTVHPTLQNGNLHLAAKSVSADGVPLPAAQAAALTYDVPVTSLPFGLKVTGVQVADDGLVGTATVNDVTIKNGQLVPQS